MGGTLRYRTPQHDPFGDKILYAHAAPTYGLPFNALTLPRVMPTCSSSSKLLLLPMIQTVYPRKIMLDGSLIENHPKFID
jgi:hypothetical protein